MRVAVERAHVYARHASRLHVVFARARRTMCVARVLPRPPASRAALTCVGAARARRVPPLCDGSVRAGAPVWAPFVRMRHRAAATADHARMRFQPSFGPCTLNAFLGLVLA